MPSTVPTKQDLGEALDRISDLADNALDPELSREELVARMKEIADLADADDEDGVDEDGEFEDAA